jgi:hypothetical protein
MKSQNLNQKANGEKEQHVRKTERYTVANEKYKNA